MHKRSICPLANCLDLVGDKWTLIILRDMYLGKRRYAEFLDSDESITTNILASRLKEMLESGLIDKRAYQEKPVRYEYFLCQPGKKLLPVVQVMSLWAEEHVQGCRIPPSSFYKLKPDDLK
ncbi:putative HxlR type transcriptional regulator [Vibrio nigripulchritudo MADA3029]|uniref:winged helix-turn-helix transcriptional regulator n=1 Tax=Vibrio nigripulchritudo TaxID=28173 RepID=UPI0003B1E47F|nr:helix-turn-helix domain-containing protein [Vibrio nigripulchritudo]CCN50016.1 putative HxlR type transcriptional regulator [Vibrio nigripulchritudo MADA3020]CCN56146.1 putative HxlR type transcriptional regulator [Vibrio nigripulchritudo MADA3021]CCN59020.1 putative HxlR type transcriptional regulator [Vibrio nigripulchritudo MADA3029]